ncbi:MAG: hypothetical protein EXS00_06465 [Phycisphaerales bacterium]|nr:hypothetical protein [Phycisphaerales bacterium]
MPSGEVAIDLAYEWMRGHLRGFLRFDGERCPLKVVASPQGPLVAPVMVAMITSTDVVLELPDDGDDHLHLMVSLEQFAERGEDAALCDRWRIYHGKPEDVNWARLHIDAARFRGMYIDGSTLMRPNPWAGSESAACRTANALPKTALAASVERLTGFDVEDPVVVGADPGGIDVRRRFDVVRVSASTPWAQPDDMIGSISRSAS